MDCIQPEWLCKDMRGGNTLLPIYTGGVDKLEKFSPHNMLLYQPNKKKQFPIPGDLLKNYFKKTAITCKAISEEASVDFSKWV